MTAILVTREGFNRSVDVVAPLPILSVRVMPRFRFYSDAEFTELGKAPVATDKHFLRRDRISEKYDIWLYEEE